MLENMPKAYVSEDEWRQMDKKVSRGWWAGVGCASWCITTTPTPHHTHHAHCDAAR
jgi:hypothetical protein